MTRLKEAGFAMANILLERVVQRDPEIHSGDRVFTGTWVRQKCPDFDAFARRLEAAVLVT